MFEYISHRINTLEQLKETPEIFGTEVDFRDRGDRLILQHDPFQDGEDAEPFFAGYRHGTLILNIKSERIEWRILELIKKYNISDYFFLDSSFPMIVALMREGERKIAVRYSEFEKMDTILDLKGKVDWVWIDGFEGFSLSRDDFLALKEAGFKLCLVSPELQGRKEDIQSYKHTMKERGITFDAICGKAANYTAWSDK